ncbi:MAG: hypothetical protein KJ964_07635 [Verrucomicrobia bacterium]|nr:hypothetical protein [Verrucomicrobiota bacterium]MBU1736259.1 hypothetical protein [Verrucomicrobiota bacterium]MBU1857657.1 hypothetical protein [Verrucomicrobiota bacterium]
MSTPGDMVIELNFVPEWARRPADQSAYARFEDRPRGRGRDRDQDRRRPGDKSGYADQRRMGTESGGKKRGGLGAPRPFRAAPGSSPSESDRRQERLPQGGQGSDNRPPPIEVTFIPERRGLKPLVARLARSGRAYPLFEVATLFLSKPDFYAVKQEVIPGAADAESVFLYQCAECKVVFLDRNRAVAHALNKHMDLFYAREETQNDPPKGAFMCVARCKLSGELLGPPNYHEFNERVLELHSTRFASMSLDAYRRQIVNETDPALIEQWKKEACRQIVYRTLRVAEPLTFKRRNQVEAHFLEHYAPTLIWKGRRFVTPGVACRDLEDPHMRRVVEESWAHENQFPLKMAVSIQPAFRHLGLHMFKASGKATFVTAIVPHPIDPLQAADGIRRILECLCAHPGVSRQELVMLLRPDTAPGAMPDAPEVAATPEVVAILHALRWMLEKGHVIEFYNGTLAIPYRKPESAKADKAAQPVIHPRTTTRV